MRRSERHMLTKTTNRPTRVISFTSGKGGVGKSNLVINVGINLARMGRSVLILDADLSLANVDVLLGLSTGHTIEHVLKREKNFADIMLTGPEGISIIPSASGVESICNLEQEHKLYLMDAIEQTACDYDYLLIDTPAGIGADVMYFNCASSEIVCVISSEPTSLTDAYALIKVMARNYGEEKISIVANNVPDEVEARLSFSKLERSVKRFLQQEQVELKMLGYVPHDPALIEAVKSQRAVTDIYPSSRASLAIAQLARSIDQDFHGLRVKGGLQFFFRQLIEQGAYGS